MSIATQPLPAPARAAEAGLRVTLGHHGERGRKAVQQDFAGACVPRSAGLRAGKGVVAALADGIGSSGVSQQASEAAVRAALEDYYGTPDAWSVKRSMQRVLAATNSWLHAQTQRGPYRHDHDRGYVCALTVLVLKGRTAHLFHCGDVRLYRLQGDVLEQLTEDHRVLVGGGKSYLSRALGFRDRLDLDYRSLPLEPGDLFVLASDGVYQHLEAGAMARALADAGRDLDAMARALVRHAFDAGSPDNLSVQIVRVDALPPARAHEARQQRAGLLPPPALAPRGRIDGFRIERELHASHRSRLVLATHLASGEPVALKVPATELREDAAALDRFALEEWIARRVDSVHVLQARHGDEPRSALYSVMEYVDGCTLAQWMRDHPAPGLDEVRTIVGQIARGLQALHRLEMVYQDLRPENVMVDRQGTVKIIDFGATRVAGLAEIEGPAPQSQALGTLACMAPECFLGEPASERSDLYALGVITYQMLCGRLPYGARVARLHTPAQRSRLAYASVRLERRELPCWLDEVLSRAVHPNPLRRHEAASEFVHALHHPPPRRRSSTGVPLVERDPVRFWRALALLLALAVVALAGLLHAGRGVATATARGAPPPLLTPRTP